VISKGFVVGQKALSYSECDLAEVHYVISDVL